MAEKRMLSMKICDTDAFLEMPLSSQCLYFHLNMRADDDGFVGNPKRIQKIIGTSEDDLKLLIMKRFLLVFESGVIVIKHWKMHNTIQRDRYKPTSYLDELAQLETKENKSYTFKKDNVSKLDTDCIQNVSTVLGLDLGLDSDIGLDLEKNSTKSVKHKFGSFKNVLLTKEEKSKLEQDYPNINIDGLIDWFSAYIEEKGYKSKSHNLAIRRWVIEAYNKPKQNNNQSKTGSRALDMLLEENGEMK